MVLRVGTVILLHWRCGINGWLMRTPRQCSIASSLLENEDSSKESDVSLGWLVSIVPIQPGFDFHAFDLN